MCTSQWGISQFIRGIDDIYNLQQLEYNGLVNIMIKRGGENVLNLTNFRYIFTIIDEDVHELWAISNDKKAYMSTNFDESNIKLESLKYRFDLAPNLNIDKCITFTDSSVTIYKVADDDVQLLFESGVSDSSAIDFLKVLKDSYE